MIDVYTSTQLKSLTKKGIIKESICVRGENIKIISGVKEIYGNLGIGNPLSLDGQKTTVIENFGDLTTIHGDLWIARGAGKLSSLNNITTVDGSVNLGHSDIKDTGHLTTVGGNFNAHNSKLSVINELKHVGGNITLPSCFYFHDFENISIMGKTTISSPFLEFSNGETIKIDWSFLTSFGKCRKQEIVTRFWEILDEFEKINGISFIDSFYDYWYSQNTVCDIKQELNSTIRELFRQAENDIRNKNGFKSVGEGWISETELFYVIKNSFPETKVIQHGKPLWLGKQHLDVYIPEYNIGIEYQGKQHCMPVDFFGGKESYDKQIERDARKKALCEKNGCLLIEVFEGTNFTDVVNRISTILNAA